MSTDLGIVFRIAACISLFCEGLNDNLARKSPSAIEAASPAMPEMLDGAGALSGKEDNDIEILGGNRTGRGALKRWRQARGACPTRVVFVHSEKLL